MRSDASRAAFEALFAAHYMSVRRYVVRRSDPADAEDVLADIFLVAWRRFDEMPEDAFPWLLGVARRVLSNQRRGERRRRALDWRLHAIRSAEMFCDEDVGSAGEVIAALGVLSDLEREALLLVAWEELEPNRAAVAAGCAPATFRVRLYRARRRLAAALAEDRTLEPPRMTEEMS
jgi:RNA polymerase sigma factor (sigma-70 family)